MAKKEVQPVALRKINMQVVYWCVMQCINE
jgi:hypothetical protein